MQCIILRLQCRTFMFHGRAWQCTKSSLHQGPLDMRLAQVPKMLTVLRNDWAPMAFFISFKLETDMDILLEKADMALKKYKMHVRSCSKRAFNTEGGGYCCHNQW